MSEKSLTPVIGKLENLFSSLNSQFFNGKLQRPVITVSPDTTKGAYSGKPQYDHYQRKWPLQPDSFKQTSHGETL